MLDKEALKKQVKTLIHSLNTLDLKGEEKKLAELEAMIFKLEKESGAFEEVYPQLIQLVHHYEAILAMQKISPEVESIQEILDKMG